ncbi:two-component system response regulator YesN [Paenibacillus endophyticus]|uniref:Two-component system response regulator YesN n=1 Tax=Paenibacillus endophyticus TaxID=1294268 RepID=A0A7W5CD22_9BACL|nr:helix-turn-helix domain-containing protein [Paenibacillus endophyticus]MBB3155377.1 two-component system response regulator YesN [Paenibacillus endophyticus]
MIDVLIVDDDKLVRKGLMSVMPWEAFGMRVVGEAANGEKALEFLKENRVELMMTDLAMPVMSGIELIRIVRKRYPEVAIAVLTLHQDFEYIQEALRLGAIDYIAKVQLEKEQFEEVLGRIHARMLNEQRNQMDEPQSMGNGISLADEVYVLLEVGDKPVVPSQKQDILSLDWRMESDGQIQIWSPNYIQEHLPGAGASEGLLPPLPSETYGSNWRLVQLRDANGMLWTDLYQLLRNYKQKNFFYECDDYEPHPIKKSVYELQEEMEKIGESEDELAKEMLHAFTWVYDDQSFYAMQGRLRELMLPIPKLMQLLYGFTLDWNRLFRAVTLNSMSLPDTLASWKDVIKWMEAFRKLALALTGNLQLSREVSGSIMSAVKIVHEELAFPLFAIDVAKRVNLSRSYFNQCFKEVVGHSFNEYLRKVRIDKAREYLAQTAKPIVWIAEHTGYADEKYFSRTFRDQTGMLPSEYRQQHKIR